MKYQFATDKDPNSLGTGVNLTPAQKEDKEARRLVRPAPKFRNVRRDVRREIVIDPTEPETGSKEIIASESKLVLVFDDDDFDDDPYRLAQACGIRPSNVHDFLCGHVNGKRKVVSALFCGVSGDTMSFDIVVDPEYRRLGLASDLVKVVIDEYESNREAVPDLVLQADAVNPNMQKILLGNGFKVTGPSHSGYNMEKVSSLLRHSLR